MTRRRDITFTQSEHAITEPITKFGGQPVWIDGAQWPLSRSTGVPMRFVCQVALRDIIDDAAYQDKLVYLFMTDSDPVGSDMSVDEQYACEAGENAVVLQPGGNCIVQTASIVDGPTLQASFSVAYGDRPDDAPVEYAVSLGESTDLDFHAFEAAVTAETDDEKANQFYRAIDGTKLGGTPCFVQGPRFPFPVDESIQVLQIAMNGLPFYVDLGDGGVGHLFLERGTNNVRFQWDGC